MSRGPRQIQPGHLTEITLKTFQARFLLRPNKLLNQLLVGVLARAQALTGMTLCAVVAMSNHIHILVVPDSEEELMRFCQYIGSNISLEVGRLRKWTGGIFRRRYSDVVVTHEPAAQVGRLKYLLSHGVKEGLVRHPKAWPGVQCVKALLSGGMKLEGIWIDRSALYEARRSAQRKKISKAKRPTQSDHTEACVLKLSKIPAWEPLSEDEYRAAVAELVDHILDEYEEQRLAAPKNPATALVEDPTRRPEKTKHSPKPVCHAASRAERQRFRERRRAFVNAYIQASERLRAGVLAALKDFPEGAFLPPLALSCFAPSPPEPASSPA
jgi:REP element-mobilizing transposase RayT